MAGMIGVLTAVPWGTVIEAAPAVVEGAAKLLRSVGLLSARLPDVEQLALTDGSKLDPQRTADAVAALESSLRDVSEQLAEATRLIANLAAASEATARRSAIHRRWLFALSGVCAVVVAAVAALLVR